MLMITIKPEHLVKILNGEKTAELRKNNALKIAILREIYNYGRSEILVYCAKTKPYIIPSPTDRTPYILRNEGILPELYKLNGKVVCKFQVKTIADITSLKRKTCLGQYYFYKHTMKKPFNLCLYAEQIYNYLKDKVGSIIPIDELEIFDKPKELSEFKKQYLNDNFEYETLTKAPQNYCYVKEL